MSYFKVEVLIIIYYNFLYCKANNIGINMISWNITNHLLELISSEFWRRTNDNIERSILSLLLTIITDFLE